MAAFSTRRRTTIGTSAGDAPARRRRDQRRTPAVQRSPRNAAITRSEVVIETKSVRACREAAAGPRPTGSM